MNELDFYRTLWITLGAGVVSMLATGLGPLPLALGGTRLRDYLGEAYAFAGGLMVSASIFSLLQPGLQRGHALEVAAGIFLGSLAFWWAERWIHARHWSWGELDQAGSRRVALIVGTMFVHSLPEGIAIGTGFASGEPGLGLYLAVAISIHNIPEGLAIGVPMRSEGIGMGRCVGWAIFSSLPQPVGAVPALLAVWLFRPLLPWLLGFAAGAMIFLVLAEMLAESLERIAPMRMAWAFMLGFLLMMLAQLLI